MMIMMTTMTMGLACKRRTILRGATGGSREKGKGEWG
jgi:hypothetical protein